jgi:hypothetical protein
MRLLRVGCLREKRWQLRGLVRRLGRGLLRGQGKSRKLFFDQREPHVMPAIRT